MKRKFHLDLHTVAYKQVNKSVEAAYKRKCELWEMI
jgi:hypothetical protein